MILLAHSELIVRCITLDEETERFLVTQPLTHEGVPSRKWFVLGGYLHLPQKDEVYEMLYPGSEWIEYHLRKHLLEQYRIEVGPLTKVRDFSFTRASDGKNIYVLHYWATRAKGSGHFDAYAFASMRWERISKVVRHEFPPFLKQDISDVYEEWREIQRGEASLRRTINDD